MRTTILGRVGIATLLVGTACVYAPLGESARRNPPALAVTHTQNTGTVPPYEVFEITFQHENRYVNPWLDVTIQVTFTAPSGRPIRIGGFNYGSLPSPHIDARSDQSGVWKARFAPAEMGRWTYSYVFSDSSGRKAMGEGSFDCVESRVSHPGFVRPNPANPYRWVFDDGTPYFPIGLQEGWGDWSGVGSPRAVKYMEGPFRTDRPDLVPLPAGSMYVRAPSMGQQNADVYARRYSRAGFNLYRFSQRNNTFDLYQDLDHYLTNQAVMTDEILVHLRKYGFRIMYGLFGFQEAFNDQPNNAEGMAKVQRFVKYSVDRWGAYVDFWEFFNEQKASDDWYAIMVPYLRSIDPYRHPITTSWERPELPGIDVNAPHDYYGSAPDPDVATVQRARKWKAQGKPVVVGEHGNWVDPKAERPVGHGGVWYPESALRMRIRNWTALFHEVVFIFWNTSYARDGHFMNIWLGPQERQYIRAMQDFANRLDAAVRMAPVTVSRQQEVRAFVLRSPERAAVYLYHFTDQTHPIHGLKVTLDISAPAQGYWYSPADAAILGRFDASAGTGTFEAPPFAIDLALLITPDGPPDLDRDGLPNDQDDDDDSDGVADLGDAFPLEAEEWADEDGDLIGDNLDADRDGDGHGDDRNQNRIPDYEELDLDGDDVDRTGAVPWDAFPEDPSEWQDTDGDGIGDQSDQDDDGDGWRDVEERRAGTDPRDPLSFPPAKASRSQDPGRPERPSQPSPAGPAAAGGARP